MCVLSSRGVPHAPMQAETHDFHVTIGRLAVEGNQAILQIRLFTDDLELGLQQYHANDAFRLKANARTDSLFAAYINEKLILRQGSHRLQGVVATSGEEMLYGYPIWWFTVTYESPVLIEELQVDHQVLLDVFEDQQNVMRITHYPSQRESMYYMVRGDSEIRVEF